MKKIFFTFVILTLCFSSAQAESNSDNYIQLKSGKYIKVFSAGKLELPKELKANETFQIIYETEIPATEPAAMQLEAIEIMQYLSTKLPGTMETTYVRASIASDGRMALSKNGADYKFIKDPNNNWVLKDSF